MTHSHYTQTASYSAPAAHTHYSEGHSWGRSMSATSPSWAPSYESDPSSYSLPPSHMSGASHYPYHSSSSFVPPREPSPPMYMRHSSSSSSMSSTKSYVTSSGQEIEFLDTAVNIPWRR